MCLTYCSNQVKRNSKIWKVTKSHVLLAKMIKLHDKSRCLKVPGKTRVLVT